MQELPDLSHLTEEERNIIMAVMDRQKEEEEKEEAMLKVKFCENRSQPFATFGVWLIVFGACGKEQEVEQRTIHELNRRSMS
uniref:Uncharacterized protein n=1 Tax=Sphaerodactylus townsendi TaxID=933632 RepID=A0ACB8GCT2_9SAUR